MRQSLCIRQLKITPGNIRFKTEVNSLCQRNFSISVGDTLSISGQDANHAKSSLSPSQDAKRTSNGTRLSAAAPTISPNFFTSQPSPYAWMHSPQYLSLEAVLMASSYTPAVVWDRYCALTSMFAEPLPLDIHQKVLRKCVISPTQLRSYRRDWGRKLLRNSEVEKWRVHSATWNPSILPYDPHFLDDTRLQSVIRNIYHSGCTPSISDYNFMLEFFTAAGNYRAPLSIFREIQSELGIHALTTETFELCFRSFAEYSEHKIHVAEMSAREHSLKTWTNEVLSTLHSSKLTLTSAMLESLLRMMQSFNDTSMLEPLLSTGYGIDLRNPDRLADAFVARFQVAFRDAISLGVAPPRVPHMSTSALNAVLTMLGRNGDTSRMVSVFEVLTSPLPRPSSSTGTINTEGYDEAEDDDPIFHDNSLDFTSQNNHLRIPRPLPPRPNTKTYERMMKFAARSQNHLLCRYLLSSAMSMDRQHHVKIQSDLRSHNSPPFGAAVAVTSNMLKSVLSTTNNVASRMEWMEKVLRTVTSQKFLDARFFRKYAELGHKQGTQRNNTDSSRSIIDLDNVQVDAVSIPLPDNNSPFIRSQFDILRHLSYLEKEYQNASQLLLEVRRTLRIWRRSGSPSPGPRSHS